jgi:hypothetical protein
MHGTYLDGIKKLPAVERLAHWIQERETIRLQRVAKKPPPWTRDPILRTYRFCNVHREHDSVTMWIDTNWRAPNAHDPNLWHAMVIARLLNWPETLGEIGYPEPWNKRRSQVGKILVERAGKGHKVFTGAYIVSTNGISTDKVSYVLQTFDKTWMSEPPSPGGTLEEAHRKLMAMHGMGNFMAAQVVADLKNTPYLQDATDWWNWCAPGPGSLRGLARLRFDFTGEVRAAGRMIKKSEFVPALLDLRKQLKIGQIKLCLQDLQNCLCEFDKYERVLWGQGKPRALYRSHG